MDTLQPDLRLVRPSGYARPHLRRVQLRILGRQMHHLRRSGRFGKSPSPPQRPNISLLLTLNRFIVLDGGTARQDAYYCAECTRLEKDRDGCPKVVNLGASRTDLAYLRKARQQQQQ